MSKKMVISFVLDETGSMTSCKSQTISGFNEFVGTLKKEDNADDVRFTLTKFNSENTEVVHDAVKLSKVANLTEESYCPASTTPLYDAIGATVKAVEKTLDGKKWNVLIAIQTDGYENASREYTQQDIFKLIEKKTKKGWQFAFLGADQDAYAASAQMGIPMAATMSYDSLQTTRAFRGMASATVAYASSGGSEAFAFDEDED